jgi:5,10-methylenetetrahydromethanopterin reductase
MRDEGWWKTPGLGLFGPPSARQAVTAAQLAERRGFGSLWVAEDYFFPSAFPLLAAAATVTERIVLCSGVVNPYSRHPALVAMEAATVSVLARERFVLGLGSSTRGWMQDQMGIPFTKPLATLRESVEIVRELWRADKASDYAGAQFRLSGVQVRIDAADRGIPIFLGVKGPRMLQLAGEVADGIILSILTSPGHVTRARRQAAAAREASGQAHRVLPIFAFILVSIGKDGPAARRAIRPTLARYLGSLHPQPFLRDAGLSEADTEPFHRALVSGGNAADMVTDALIDQFSVSGSPDECRSTLRRFAAAGLDAPAFLVPHDLDFEQQVTLMADELLPCWAQVLAERG